MIEDGLLLVVGKFSDTTFTNTASLTMIIFSFVRRIDIGWLGWDMAGIIDTGTGTSWSFLIFPIPSIHFPELSAGLSSNMGVFFSISKISIIGYARE